MPTDADNDLDPMHSAQGLLKVRQIVKHKLWTALTAAALVGMAPSAMAQAKASAKTAPPANCFVSEFKQLALSTHEPIARSQSVLNWLATNVKTCTVEQLVMINTNRSAWLGTSDTAKMASILGSMIEFKVAGKPEMLNQIFGSMSVDRPDAVTISSGPPPLRNVPIPGVEAVGQLHLMQPLPSLPVMR